MSITHKKDIVIFNTYVAEVTGTFKASSRRAAKNADVPSTQEEQGRRDKKLAALIKRRHELTPVQFLRQRAKITASERPGKKPVPLRDQFLEILPRVAQVEGWSAAELRNAGVPYADLAVAGLYQPRGRKPSSKKSSKKAPAKRPRSKTAANKHATKTAKKK